MKTLLILLFISFNVFSQPCPIFKGNNTENIVKIEKKHKKPSEIITITGWSVISQYELALGIPVNKYGCSGIQEKISKHFYKNCIVTLLLDANVDTGNDCVIIYYGNILIYKKDFGDNPQLIKLSINLDTESKLRFVVNNSKYLTPGATSCDIKIKEI